MGFPSFSGLSGLGQTDLKDALRTIFFAHSSVPEEETGGQESINNFALVVEDRPLSNGGHYKCVRIVILRDEILPWTRSGTEILRCAVLAPGSRGRNTSSVNLI